MEYKTWECKEHNVKIDETDYDYDCHAYDICMTDTNAHIITIYPASVADSDDCRQRLDNGECPICDGWEDGMGNDVRSAYNNAIADN